MSAPAISARPRPRLLTLAPPADLAVLDPMFTAYVTRHHALMVFDTLYGLDEDLRPRPQMVEGALSEEGGRRWRFTLRPGLLFHDGEPVRARDCVASILRWAQLDSVGQWLMARVDALVAKDDRVFSIRLTEPFHLLPDIFAKLAVPILAIMPERLAATPASTRLAEMVGSGPFRFKAAERVPGALNVYERFARYRPRDTGAASCTAGPKVAHFNRVEWHTMPNQAAADALERGEIDWWEFADADRVPSLRANPALCVAPTSRHGFMASLQLNPLHPPMDNPAFRRVLLAAVRQSEFMMPTAAGDPGLFRDDVGVFPPGTPLATPEGLPGRELAGDTRRLMQALGESGYAGEKVVLLRPDDFRIVGGWADVAARTLERIGVNVETQTMDWGTLLARRGGRDPVGRGGWSLYPTSVDGIEQASPLTHRVIRGISPSAALGWLDSPELERARDAFLTEGEPVRRRALADRIQDQAMTDVPYIPIGRYTQMTAHRRDLEGRLGGVTLFWNIRRSA